MTFRVIEEHEHIRSGEIERTEGIEFEDELEGAVFVLDLIRGLNAVAEGKRTPRFFNPLGIIIERV